MGSLKLPASGTNYVDANAIIYDAADDELERLVARIKARGAELSLPQPSPDAVAAFLRQTEHETAMSGEELEEHERMWRAVDDEIHAIERANDRAEG